MPLIDNLVNRKLVLYRYYPVSVPSIVRIISVLILCCSLTSFSPVSYSAPLNTSDKKQNILIIHQTNNRVSQELVTQLKSNKNLANYNIHHAGWNGEATNLETINRQQLIIAIGSKTTKSLLDANISAPILSILMPEHLAKSFQKLYNTKGNWSSLVIDQPLERKFHLITAIMGKNKKTGVLLGSYTKDLEKPLKRAARETRQSITIEHINNPEEIPRSLNTLNNTVNILLTLPDPVIYNKNTIRGILLSTYREKLPIIGFSKAYVKAGAIAAVYSKPEQISKQTAVITNNFLKNNFFSQNIYQPNDFSVALNHKLAKSLGINIKSESEILKQIKQAERRR